MHRDVRLIRSPLAVRWPQFDLNNPTQRRTAVTIFLLPIANIVIVGDDPSGARRRGKRTPRYCIRHSLAHERAERDRVHRQRCRPTGHPICSDEGQRGNVREYLADGVTPEQLAKGERRRMDCTDCHNRPSHAIAATPERAVNDAMARGQIPATLPFIHREAVKVLKQTYSSQETAGAEISRRLGDFYGTEPTVAAARAPDIERAILGVQDLFHRNVFPAMKVGFGTYPNNIGHVDSPGCFRCHDDNHKAKDGKKIGQDCETCHAIE